MNTHQIIGEGRLMCFFYDYIDLSTAKLLLTERKSKLKYLFFINYSLVYEPKNVKWNGRENYLYQ